MAFGKLKWMIHTQPKRKRLLEWRRKHNCQGIKSRCRRRGRIMHLFAVGLWNYRRICVHAYAVLPFNIETCARDLTNYVTKYLS